MPSPADSAAPAIFVDGVSKAFDLPTEQVHTLKERAMHPFRRQRTERFEALRDVSFHVRRGECFGITGRNGSGKSTLLKCIAGIYGVGEGAIYVDGAMSTFIELGVGFNVDLPATDNILLNATMLGLSPREARSRVDAVLDFAELREFADLKVKNYSSGMLVRLAFSVMIQVDAEILVIDEVLAVGDAAFQQKCYEEFEKIRESDKTVLFVTHDMGAIQRFCDRAMLLERGRVVTIGEPEAVGKRYMQLNFSEAAREAEEERALAVGPAPQAEVQFVNEEGQSIGDGRATITEAWFENSKGEITQTVATGEQVAFTMRVRFNEDVEDPLFSMAMLNSGRQQLFGTSSQWDTPHSGTYRAGEEAVCRITFENILAHDRYWVAGSVELEGGVVMDFRQRMFAIYVTSTRSSGALVHVPNVVTVTRGEQYDEVAG